MQPVINDRDLKVYLGDSLEVTKNLPTHSVDCIITSPPFWGLRDYGADGQIGLEKTVDEWVSSLNDVFLNCWAALADHGTLWVELGDSYQDKNLVGSPWLFAFAMKREGWILRQCIIWNKPNAMPESSTDRCTAAHSYIFLFSKKQRYYFDHVAIQEPAEWARWGDQTNNKYEGSATASGWMKGKTKDELPTKNTKNARSVWTVPTGNFSEAHFATFPEPLVERMLNASCPQQVCVTCHLPRQRMMSESEGLAYEGEAPSTGRPDGAERRNPRGGQKEWDSYVPAQTVGWTDCGCGDGFRPGVVLDPFFGAGTTGVVARRLGLHAVGIELNPEYIELIRKRTEQLSLLA